MCLVNKISAGVLCHLHFSLNQVHFILLFKSLITVICFNSNDSNTQQQTTFSALRTLTLSHFSLFSHFPFTLLVSHSLLYKIAYRCKFVLIQCRTFTVNTAHTAHAQYCMKSGVTIVDFLLPYSNVVVTLW